MAEMKQELVDTTGRDTIGIIHQEIENAHSRMEKWHKRARRCTGLYRGEGDDANSDSDKFKIMWMVTEIQRPALYTGGAQADVRRKHLDKDPLARTASQLLERTTQCCMDDELHEFDYALDSCVSDYATVGRGQSRVVYDAEFEPSKKYINEDEKTALEMEGNGEDIKSDETGFYLEGPKKKVSEDAWIEHVRWDDFAHSDGHKWEDVWWVAFASWLTKEDLTEQFGKEIAEEVPTCGMVRNDEQFGDYLGYEKGRDDFARVWEFWSKRTGKVYKVAQNYREFLEKPRDDPYGLKGFFPCPRPLDMINTTGRLEPIPEYKMYEDQALEINRLTGRIDRLIESIKACGIYDPRLGSAVGKLFDADDNEMIAAEDFASVANSGGIEGSVMFSPIGTFADVLAKLAIERQQNKEIVYEVVGLGDVMRGVTNPREAYKTQEMKAQLASGSTSRMRRKQKRVERFVRDDIRLLAEIVGELFDEETILAKSNLEVEPQKLNAAVQLLRSDTAREYKIDVESDTTVAQDDEQRKQEFTEFMTALSGMMSQGMQAAEAGMLPPGMVAQFILYGVRRFKGGRNMEEEIEQAFQQMEEAKKQQEGKPSPEQEAAQAKQQLEMQKLELKKQEMMADMQMNAAELGLKAQELEQKGQIEQAKIMQKQRSDIMNYYTVLANQGQGRPEE